VNISFQGSYALKNNLNVTPFKGNSSANKNYQPAFNGIALSHTRGLVRGAARFAQTTSDDIARSGPAKKLLHKGLKHIKRAFALITATITGAVVAVRNIGDDIRFKFKTKATNVKIKPAKLSKDAIQQLKRYLAELDDPLYYAHQKAAGPGISDVIEKAEKGISQATGVRLKDSGKHILLSKLKGLFSRAASGN
jgi:hypothetical protein